MAYRKDMEVVRFRACERAVPHLPILAVLKVNGPKMLAATVTVKPIPRAREVVASNRPYG